MPKTTRTGKAKKSELPSTLRHSDDKAQRTFAKAHDAAADQYDGDAERAHRVAFAALEHSYEKVGDHWEEKEERGPSDAQAEGGWTGTARLLAAWTRTPRRSTSSASPGASR